MSKRKLDDEFTVEYIPAVDGMQNWSLHQMYMRCMDKNASVHIKKFIRDYNMRTKDIVHSIEVTWNEDERTHEVALSAKLDLARVKVEDSENPLCLNGFNSLSLRFNYGREYGYRTPQIVIKKEKLGAQFIKTFFVNIADAFPGSFGVIKMKGTSLKWLFPYLQHVDMGRECLRIEQWETYEKNADHFLRDFACQRWRIDDPRRIPAKCLWPAKRVSVHTTNFSGQDFLKLCHSHIESLEVQGFIQTHHLGRAIIRWLEGRMDNLKFLAIETFNAIDLERLKDAFGMVPWTENSGIPRYYNTLQHEPTKYDEGSLDCKGGFIMVSSLGQPAVFVKERAECVLEHTNWKADVFYFIPISGTPPMLQYHHTVKERFQDQKPEVMYRRDYSSYHAAISTSGQRVYSDGGETQEERDANLDITTKSEFYKYRAEEERIAQDRARRGAESDDEQESSDSSDSSDSEDSSDESDSDDDESDDDESDDDERDDDESDDDESDDDELEESDKENLQLETENEDGYLSEVV